MSDSATTPPKDLSALIRDALALLDRGQTGAAEQLLQAALAADPAQADALQLLGLIRRSEQLDHEAEDLYRRSLAANPKQPHVHHNLGNLLVTQRRYDEAIAAQREAIRQKPTYMEALLALGRAQQESGDLPGAEKTFRAMLHVQPHLAVAKQCLAGVLTEQNRPKEAETILRQAIGQGVSNPRQLGALTHNLGIALKKQKRHNEALAQFDAAKQLVPDMPLVDYNRGATLQILKRNDDALEAYRVAIARNPADIMAHRDLNQLLYRLDRTEEFLRSYDDAMTVLPEFASLPLGKGDLLYRQGRFAEAHENFERAVMLAPDSVSAHDGLGLSLLSLGEVGAALRQHEKALAMEPENVGVRVNTVATLLRAGRCGTRSREVRRRGGHRALRTGQPVVPWRCGGWPCARWAVRARGGAQRLRADQGLRDQSARKASPTWRAATTNSTPISTACTPAKRPNISARPCAAAPRTASTISSPPATTR